MNTAQQSGSTGNINDMDADQILAQAERLRKAAEAKAAAETIAASSAEDSVTKAQKILASNKAKRYADRTARGLGIIGGLGILFIGGRAAVQAYRQRDGRNAAAQ